MEAVEIVDTDFVDPPWHAPLDAATEIAAIPDDAEVAGMFFMETVRGAQQRGVMLQSARERYVPFRFYPVREFAALLAEASSAFFPQLPLRQGLRMLGRGAPRALLKSTVGRVMLGSTEGVLAATQAMVKTYPINVRPSQVEVLAAEEGRVVAGFRDMYYFLDSHHVGVLEGAMGYAGVDGRVRVCRRGPGAMDMLCSW